MVDGSARISDMVGAVSRMSEEQVSVPLVESRMSSHPVLSGAGEESLPGSPNLRTIRHPRLGLWIDFRKRLAPRYVVVWTDLTLCILLALGGFAGHVVLTAHFGNAFGFAVGLPFAIWIGFWLNSILTFGHEAAHYNLAHGHRSNDLLADWTIWLFFPQTTRGYRKSHWQHHLHLGDPQDTEISYHNCFSPWFLIKTLTGIHLGTLLLRYALGHDRPRLTAQISGAESPGLQKVRMGPLLRSLAVHLIIIGSAIVRHAYASAVVWLVSAAVIFPFFASIRQLLEHRSAEAGCDTNFQQVLHGPVNRIFGSDVFSRYFGAAGFNRHLFHHWDPTISYTRFNDMQKFLAESGFGEHIQVAQSSYFATALLLFRRARDANQ